MASPKALLVGSVPLGSAEEVFTSAAHVLGDRLQQIPDGETGHRANFIAWQHGVFPITIVQPRWGGQPTPESLSKTYFLSDLKPTSYDDVAIESYALFQKLKTENKISPGAKFQVCLPSVSSVVKGFVEGDETCLKIEPLYLELLLRALHNIQDKIPASELSIQFDMPNEVAALEADAGRLQDQFWTPYFKDSIKQGVLDRIRPLIQAVRHDVDLGLHLCYGDLFHTHFIQPEDTTILVTFANTLVKEFASVHKIKYITIPVPKDRQDDAYFVPLNKLNIGTSRLYLGVVHPGDEQGTRKRLQIARTHLPSGAQIGLTTECGLGRCTPEEAKDIFRILKVVE